MNIRNANLKDIDSLMELNQDLIDIHNDILKKQKPEHLKDFEEKENSKRVIKRFIKKLIRSKKGYVIVAEENDKIIAYLIAMVEKNIPIFTLKKYVEISDLFVKEEFQGKKIGLKLVQLCISWAKQNNFEKIVLKVFPNNKNAVEFYKKIGFSDFFVEMRKNL
jgi:ribosomal protein S18 acetylase RimI-like enzyme